MARFPTVGALAAAPPADVLREWRGLGYNRRALNLWRAARRIVEVFDGRVPSDLDDLQSLPGVGPYTARAVAALAFGSPVGAVDTNVRRVLGRIVAGDAGTLSGAQLQRLADEVVPVGRAGDWTHALMDLGATLCRPRRPDCGACPAKPWCRYAGLTDVRARASLTTAAAGTGAQSGASARRQRRLGLRRAGSEAGSWTGCAKLRTESGSVSKARSGSTDPSRSRPPRGPWRRTACSSSISVLRSRCGRVCRSPDVRDRLPIPVAEKAVLDACFRALAGTPTPYARRRHISRGGMAGRVTATRACRANRAAPDATADMPSMGITPGGPRDRLKSGINPERAALTSSAPPDHAGSGASTFVTNSPMAARER